MYGKDVVLKTLEDVVRDFGADYVYPFDDPNYTNRHRGGCLYRRKDNGQPACIVAQVLDRFGLLDEAVEGQSFDYGSGASQYFTDEAIEILGNAQLSQDMGNTWGYSLESAKAESE